MKRTLRVLLVEDMPTDGKLVIRELERAGHEVIAHRVEDPVTMLEALEQQSWDVIVSDWSLPAFNALEALTILKDTGFDIPFIIVSGTVGEELAVEAMRAGANDYVLKDKLTRLAPAVEREMREFHAHQLHRESERKLKASEARFARLEESGMLGIVVVNIDGAILEANAECLRLLGLSEEEALDGRAWAEFTSPALLPQTQEAMEHLRVSGFARPYESVLVRPDGTEVSVLVGAAMLDYPRCIAFLADLTERRKAEEALRRTEDQLRQAQKMEAIGILAGGVAHDFNNLLSVILSYSAMLSEDLAEENPMKADLEQISAAGKRAADLTHQLLAFSRKQILQPRLVNMNEVVGHSERILRRLVSEDIELRTLLAADLGQVRLDAGQMEQVLMNLVVNARDAMRDGGKILIETANVVLDEEYARDHVGVTPGPHVMLAVTDNGIGMDRETQEHMFEPFFTTKELGKGTGLGLSTAFGIVKQSGGSIWAYSEPGVGTTFKIYFPVVRDPAVPTPSLHPVVPERMDGNETLLLVEDEARVRALAATILLRHGYRVLVADDVEHAIRTCEGHQGPIHLLLTDVVMPKMSGRILAQQLCGLRPELRVLYMSGYTDNSIIHHGVLDANVAFLQKPITPTTLVRKVREVLDSPATAPAGGG
jgi:two-component system cell cycle sensor histidine kinase/response regulator CckA